ncbi:DUF3027 domain-containing protein [Sinomonas mesophila]|uniref:DUF3027 domain-containing protein n=1 Tax=Sinomonas mesophila TaxID=1531955 RepID=UPI000986E041|nr:DUF3027 domain-containing protein [Sinomonas mesophila]
MVAPTAPSSSAPKRKAGVPVWRVGKPDAFLASAVEAARSALLETVRADEVGEHVAAKSEGERVVTHLFESRLAGYRGWYWFVTVARVARSKAVTVNEVGLVPSEDAVLAPEWVPWAERVRPEDREAAEDLAVSERDASETDVSETDERDAAEHDAGERYAAGEDAAEQDAADVESAAVQDASEEQDA